MLTDFFFPSNLFYFQDFMDPNNYPEYRNNGLLKMTKNKVLLEDV